MLNAFRYNTTLNPQGNLAGVLLWVFSHRKKLRLREIKTWTRIHWTLKSMGQKCQFILSSRALRPGRQDLYNIEVKAESEWVWPLHLAVGFFISKIFRQALSCWGNQNSFQQNEDLLPLWECCYLALSAPESTPWNPVVDLPPTILLIVSRSDEQGGLRKMWADRISGNSFPQ